MKILVSIPTHGHGHDEYLQHIIDEFRAMAYDVDVVLFSNVPRDLGSDVEVQVVTDLVEPRALPYEYKRLFRERRNDYDLYIYTEDDTFITQENIDAFLWASELLPPEELPGFVRYELDAEGRMSYSTFHTWTHWDPKSVKVAGGEIFAYLTNQHAACFMLTRDQLHRAIESGGFDAEPREGRYAMLATAATEPYTVCGFRKMVCASRLEQFRLHHMHNKYLNRLGAPVEEVELQVEVLRSIANGKVAPDELLNPSSGLESGVWDKLYYEPRREDILAHTPDSAKSVLSLACGAGYTEEAWVEAGLQVTAVPMDHVLAAVLESKGIEVTPPDFDAARRMLEGRRFDLIVFSQGLHLLPNPSELLEQFLPLLAKDGLVIAGVPNFGLLRLMVRRMRSGRLVNYYNVADALGDERLSRSSRQRLKSRLKRCGIKTNGTKWNVEGRWRLLSRLTMGMLDEAIAFRGVVIGKKVMG